MNELVVKLEDEVHPVVAAAEALIVDSEEKIAQATAMGRVLQERKRLVTETLEPGVKKSYEAYQHNYRVLKGFLDPIEAAKKTLSNKIYTCKTKIEDERRRVVAEARRQAEAEAEQKRRVEEEARLLAAERLAAQGMNEEAEELLDAPTEVQVAPIVPQAGKLKVEGTNTRENWQFEIEDPTQIPRLYLTPDTVKIGKLVKALKGETRIPGVRVYDSGTVAFR